MMARLAEFRDDTSGLLATTGTATAYTVITNQGLAATPNNGQLIAFTPHVTNGVAATLAADGGGAFAIQTSPGVAVSAAVLVQGTPYLAKFVSASSAWILMSFFSNPFNIPIGGCIDYFGTTAPNANYALPAAQAISRTIYSTLFALIGTTFGVGDGTTTFNIPDLRGRVLAGLDNLNGGVPAGRISVAGGNFDGTVFGGTGGSQNHILTNAELPAHNHSVTDTHSHNVPGGGNYTQGSSVLGSLLWANAGGPTATTGTVAGSIVVNNSTGGGGAHSILPPMMMVGKILRII